MKILAYLREAFYTVGTQTEGLKMVDAILWTLMLLGAGIVNGCWGMFVTAHIAARDESLAEWINGCDYLLLLLVVFSVWPLTLIEFLWLSYACSEEDEETDAK